MQTAHFNKTSPFNQMISLLTWTLLSGGIILAGFTFSFAQPFVDETNNHFIGGQALKEADVSWGDVDGDGNPEIFMMGNDGGSFTKLYYDNPTVAGINYVASTYPFPALKGGESAFGDMNNDGDLDIAYSGRNTSNQAFTYIYKSQGSGWPNFGMTQHQVLLGMGEGSLAWGDYDNDGDQDLLVTGNSNTLGSPVLNIKLYNNDDGTFVEDPTASQSLLGVIHGQVKWADYDNDGWMDIFMVGQDISNDPKLRLYKNLGNSVFQLIPVSTFTSNEVRNASLALADFDHDDDLDLLVSGNKSSTGTNLITKVIENQGNNQFAEIATLTGLFDGEAAWGDYDHDGYADILLVGSDGTNGQMLLYHNNQNGTFTDTTPASFLGLFQGASVAFGDYNGDRKLDILAVGSVNNFAQTWRLYRNNTGGSVSAPPAPSSLSAVPSGNSVTFSWASPLSGSGYSYNIFIGNTALNQDHEPALADLSNGDRFVFETGNIQGNTWTISNIPGVTSMQNLTVKVQSVGADFQGSDFSAQANFDYTPPTSGPQIFKDTTSSMFTGSPPPGLRKAVIEWGDFDADGDLDFFSGGNTSTSAGSGDFRVWRNNGNGTFTQFGTVIPSNIEGFAADWGDFNANGYLDLVITGKFNGTQVQTLFYQFNGSSFQLNNTPNITGVEDGSVDWGDVDNDGDLDLLITGKASGGAFFGPISHIYLNDGSSTNPDFTLHQQLPPNSSVDNSDAKFADFNKDGWLDFVLTGRNNSGVPTTQLYRNKGDGTFELLTTAGNLDDVMFSNVDWGDYNNDGFLDLAISGQTAGSGRSTKVYAYIEIPGFFTGFSAIGTQFEDLSHGSISWGDYDDDGWLDLVVTGDDGVGGKAYLYRNLGNSAGFALSPIGSTDLNDVYDGSTVAWADFDEDGKLDLAMAGRLSGSSSSITKLFRNKDLSNPNSTPTPPTLNDPVFSGFDVELSWNPPAASNGGWTYVVYLDQGGGNGDVRSPMADIPGGFRQIVEVGEVGQATTATFRNLPPGSYTWSVQSIDQDFEGSAFATPKNFTYVEPTFVNMNDTLFPPNPPLGPIVGLSNASLAWGDYDKDNDLDLVACGTDAAGNPATALYLYDNGLYSIDVSSNNLVDVENGSVDWGDMNNDGYLDLLITGHDGTGEVSKVYVNLLGDFPNQPGFVIDLTGVSNSSGKWIDYNMDGLRDILITGETAGSEDIKLYINQGNGVFSPTTPNIQAVSHGDIAVGDFDNNGYPDVAIAGETNGVAFARIYSNNEGQSFTPFSTPSAFLPLTDASLDFGDINADGFLDIAIAGRRTANNARVSRVLFNNQSGSLNASFLSLTGVQDGSVDLGDYDNDGYKDLLLTGNSTAGRVIELYRYNNGSNQLNLVSAGTSGMPTLDDGSDAAWGDFNNDGKLDVAIVGTSDNGKVIHIFKNIDSQPASGPPPPPTNLDYQISGYDVLLSWSPPTGVTHPKALSYEVFIGSGSATNYDSRHPESSVPAGRRFLVKPGQVNDTTTFRMSNLPAGNYCWGVQAINANFEGSTFAQAFNANPVLSKCFSYEPPAFVNATATTLGGSVSGLDQGDLEWADYDNDGDLDLLVLGQQSGTVNASHLFRNNGSGLAAVADPFPAVHNATAAWGDIDGDNDLDVVISGRTAGGSGAPVARIYRNNNGTFALRQNLAGVEKGSVDWGDFDRDGDLDLLMMGTNNSGQAQIYIYENTGINSASFSTISAGLDAATDGVATWVDYDKDGFLDIFLTGNGSSNRIIRFYHNEGPAGFVQKFFPSNIPATSNAAADWGDINNDGYPDLALIGSTSSGLIGNVYLNGFGGGNTFSVGPSLTALQNGDVKWGDYDNDGWTDVVITGNTTSGRETRVYRNNGSSLVYLSIISGALTNAGDGSAISWGDYNGDKKLDLALLGRSQSSPVTRILQVYENVDPSPNNFIDTPRTLVHQVVGDTIKLSWLPPLNMGTITGGLTYNIYFGTNTQLGSIASPQAFTSGSDPGLRKVVLHGNSGHKTEYQLIGIPTGNYRWSVQAIGQDFEGSEFAAQQTLNYTAPAFVDVTSLHFASNAPGGYTESAMAWSDYDGDGDLDLTISGLLENGKPATHQYEQAAGTFTLDQTQSGTLLNLSSGDIAWGDIDRDQDVDLLLIGLDSLGNSRSQVYTNNGSGTLSLNTALSNDIADVSEGAAAWGDYDNDGDLDLALTGKNNGLPFTAIYRNEGGQLIPEPGLNLLQLSEGDLAWGDYDGDGYLDLLITGRNGNQLSSRVYHNNGVIGGFTALNLTLPGVYQSSVSWGDYDTDGKLDFLLTGESSISQVAPIAQVYHFESGSFVKRFDLNPGVKTGDATWVDYSDDGLPDIIITGKHGGSQTDRSTFVYLNTNGTGFQEDVSTGGYLIGPDNGSSLAVGDFDANGKIDLAITGQVADLFPRKSFRLYTNASQSVNLKADPPTIVNATQSADSVIFTWTPPASYPSNRVNGLSYNLIITQTPGGAQQYATMADPGTGMREVVSLGGIYSRTNWSIRNLPAGNYNWRIQAIGPDFEGSTFSTTGSFNFQPPAFVNMNSVAFRPPLTAANGLSNSDLEWGDYDNDGDLDLVVNGRTNSATVNTLLYENIEGRYFELNSSASTTLTDVRNGQLSWADINGDEYLDLIVTGISSSGRFGQIYLNDGQKDFTALTSNFVPPVQNSGVAWGDYDNDGGNDLLLIGNSLGGMDVSSLLHNEKDSTFTQAGNFTPPLTGVEQGDLSWVDFNSDGLMDMVITGLEGANPISWVYQNDGGGDFTRISPTNLPGVSLSTMDWADMDNDGYPDALITGIGTSGPISGLYKGNGDGTFTEVNINLPQLAEGQAVWGDYDNDERVDILISGKNSANARVIKIFHNDGGTFSEDTDASSSLIAVEGSGDVAWGDYDKDGKLDVVVAGISNAGRTLTLFKNKNTNANTRLAAPDSLGQEIVGSNVVLSWTPPPGVDPSIVDGLSYNLFMGTDADSSDFKPAHAFIPGSENGLRKVVRLGNVGQTLRWMVGGLVKGEDYTWGVQAIGHDFEGSPFATSGFSFNPPAFEDVSNELFSGATPQFSEGVLLAVDYDGDQDMDFFASGSVGSAGSSKIYRNTTNGQGEVVFEEDLDASGDIWDLYEVHADWGDYDNDGDPDLVISGLNNATPAVPLIAVFNNEDGRFTIDQDATDDLPAVSDGSLNWGDYDNDGDLDLILTGKLSNGSPISRIYQNTNARFDDVTNAVVGGGLPGVNSGMAVWGDYDQDGDLDFSLTGASVGRIYKNKGDGTFEDGQYGIATLKNSFASWGDKNNDGILELLVTGDNAAGGNLNATTLIYRYNSMSDQFTEDTVSLENLTQASALWGDFNNDGWQDLMISGQFDTDNSDRKTLLYRNDGTGNLGEDLFSSNDLRNIALGSMAWLDYDKDGRLDMVLAGIDTLDNRTFAVYHNIDTVDSEVPGVPRNIESKELGAEIELTWDPPASASADILDGLSYNIYISRLGDSESVKSAHAHLNSGYRKLVAMGNTSTSTRWAVSGLDDGTYVWSVQTISQDFEGSPFPEADTFTFSNPVPVFVTQENARFYPLGRDAVQSQVLLKDRSIVDTVEVYYRGITDTSAFKLGVLSVVDDWYVFDIDSNHIDDLGVEYYYLARGTFGFNATSDTGYTYIEYPDGLPYQYDDLRFGKEVTDYNVIAFPLVLDNKAIGSVLDELGTYDIYKWRLFFHEGEEKLEFQSGLNNFEEGKSYWLISKNEIDQINTGPGHSVEVTKSSPFTISLNPGYNQIGNPYSFNIDWDRVLEANPDAAAYLTRNPITYGPSGWRDINLNIMEKYRGIFVFADTAVEIGIPVFKDASINRFGDTPTEVKARLDRESWVLPLSLSAGKLEYPLGGIGMDPEADESKDVYDWIRPPRLSEYMDVSFEHPEFFASNFTRDIVPTQKNYIWEFSIESNLKEKEIRINWDNSAFGSSGMQLVLFDLEHQRMVPMNDFSTYLSISDQKNRPFKIYYGSEAFIREHLQPEWIHLGAAFPNPSFGKVMILFNLPESPELYEVKLEILDAMGKRISVALNEKMGGGFHEVEWNALDGVGNRVASGLYIYRLSVYHNGKSAFFTARMILK